MVPWLQFLWENFSTTYYYFMAFSKTHRSTVSCQNTSHDQKIKKLVDDHVVTWFEENASNFLFFVHVMCSGKYEWHLPKIQSDGVFWKTSKNNDVS
jgi:hypothetical protein